MGGPVSIEAARLLGDKVVAIVGVDTFQDLTMMMTEEQKTQMLTPFLADFATTTEMFVHSLFPPGSDSSLVERVAKDMAAGSSEVGLGSFENLFTYNASEALQDVRVPIRCINADRFPTNVDGNRQVSESFEVTYIEGHGHFPHMADS